MTVRSAPRLALCALALTALPTAAPPAAAQAAPADTAVAVRWHVRVERLAAIADSGWARAEARAARGDSLGVFALDAAGRPPDAFRAAILLGPAQLRAAEDAAAAGASVRAAVASASAGVLAGLSPYPDVDAAVWQALAADLLAARRLDGATRSDAGLALGRACAERVLAWAAADRSDVRWAGTLRTGEGVWAGVPGRPPAGASILGQRPWLLTSSAQVRPPPPPAPGSAAFADALDEVRRIAAARTPEQTALAQAWARPDGFARLAADVLAGASEADAARAYAVLGAALWDARLACWEAKYHYLTPRPFHADPALAAVEGVGRPNHPSYPSGHACLSGAVETVLTALAPAARERIARVTAEGRESRLYGGVHFRFDNDAGLAVGRAVGALALAAAADGHLMAAPFGAP